MTGINMYWVYDLPSWLFGLLTIAVFLAFGLVGLFPTRAWVRRQHRIDHSHNDIVGYYLAAVTVFYGVTLGLVAVGTWTTHSDVETRIDREAETLSRDVDGYPADIRDRLQADLRAYTQEVIEVSWPQQREGIVPVSSGLYIQKFQTDLMNFQPATIAQQVLQAEVFRQFNDLVECRRARLNSTTAGMPASLWTLVILGAVVSIVVTLFFDTPSFSMHFWMTVCLCGLLGLMIFLVGSLDNPFRGKTAVSPAPLERVYQALLAKSPGSNHTP
jgi:hypothetical protein